MLKIPRKKCLNCHTETQRARYIYCSNTCQASYQHKVYIKKWKEGHEIGLQRIGVVSVHIKKYLREKYLNKCCICSWAKVNIKTGIIPLVADHIDGNWRNNQENNLRLICPNCDAISPTYAALNTGNGRKNRSISKRAEEGRILIKKRQSSSVGRATVS
jgi:hypothetical protein